MRLDSLLSHGLRHTLRISPFELPRQQVAQPPLEQRNDTPHEEQPYPPSRRPEANTRPLPNRSSVEPRVNQVLQVLAHPYLFHEAILITVHPGQLTDMGEHVLQTVCKLESIDVAQSKLDVGVHDKLGESKDLSTQVEGVSESRLLPLLRGKGFDRFQIHVVIEMEVVKVLSVDKEVQHVVTLSAYLQTRLNPVERCLLEELGALETAEKISFRHGFRWLRTKSVENVDLE